MEKDQLQTLFKTHKKDLYNAHTPEGHEMRFLSKIETQVHGNKKTKQSRFWISIAASIVLLLAAGFTMATLRPAQSDLASVSPEMEATQSFFTATIQKELIKLNSYQDDVSKHIITDALTQLNKLEKEYDVLKVNLSTSGQNKKVINAMIQNFQNRIELLNMVTSQIEAFSTLKLNSNETTL